MKHEKFKMTPLERAWILYDVGNSAFVLMIATLVPIFFNALAEAGGLSSVNYLAYWGYASSVVTVITAVLGPILGTLADTRGFKKPIFMLCLFVGVAGCCAMGLATTWLPFLIIFILAKIGFSGSLVFYDSMLGDVTTPERMDVVSSQGYAWGYIGSCVPFVVCLALVLGSGAIGLSQMTALSVALLITAVWWLGTTLPLLRNYKQINYVEVEQHAIRQSFVRIGHTLKHLREDKQVFWFLLAFFCYLDGVPQERVLDCERRGVVASLKRRGLPLCEIELERTDEFCLGGLIFLLETVTALVGLALGVDPFDQPGVEEGKNYALALCGSADYATYLKTLEDIEAGSASAVFSIE